MLRYVVFWRSSGIVLLLKFRVFSFEELSALNGIVTTATINSQCNKELTLTTNQTDINWRKTQCEALSKPGVIINEAVLLYQTPQGGRVYLKKKIQ
jgi:hypothetical protein